MTVRIERLADHHQRTGFDCGEPALNEFLLRQANQLNRKGFGKTYVALADDGFTVTGFVTVSAGQVQTRQLPTHLKLLRYPAPVLRVGRLAVSTREQGRGICQNLMAFALQLAFEFSQQVGLYAVIVDAKQDQSKVFYESLGFTATLDDPLCLFLPISTLQKVRSGPQ
ncbi:acetyltransferase (GNAT) family protein [mine drainage metagenome]|uniref:Acetyltransferase (GNAT) family protein n=1 Tax=mine drainage metagenome TaxID=410659 RepID=A0A1J5PTK1_9ZZZZ